VIDINDLAADLDDAIETGGISAAFQPQISLLTGATIAIETLCRWTHPVLGAVSPDTFIGVAEQTGSITRLGQLMLATALDAAAHWRAQGHSVEVSVNVSPLQVVHRAFLDHALTELGSRGVPPEALILEITESLPLSGSHQVLDLLREYRAQGIGLSLDDFGTGHASLEHLESLPVSEVKLDGTLIREVDAHTDVELREVMSIARDLGVRVVAEGIETQEQLERAAALRCDRGQGYLLCRPRPRDDIDRVLARAAQISSNGS
jgi:EAL domain-containing protein (putative c-di-GMP-specific phosphodiesterase class I)